MSFGKGTVHPPERSSFQDEATGAIVWQLTSHAAISHPTYFLHSSFTPDGEWLVFTSYRTGNAQLFECGLQDGQIRQMTEGPPIHPYSPLIHPGGQSVFFVRRGEIWTIDRNTLEERCIAAFEQGQLGECSLSADGEWLTAAARLEGQAGLVVGRVDGAQWGVIAFPRTVIHPQFHPLDPEWLVFAGDPAPRMHRVKRDGTGLECIYEHGNDEFIVHETFLGVTGDLVFTVWPFALKRMDWSTREQSVISEFNAWHITSNRAGTQVLCDTNHPDEGIFLVDVAGGSRQRVCLSRASNRGSQWQTSRYALPEDFARAHSEIDSRTLSWMETAADTVYGPQWTHPHPSFSFDEKKIAFASDRTGVTQVYVAELE